MAWLGMLYLVCLHLSCSMASRMLKEGESENFQLGFGDSVSLDDEQLFVLQSNETNVGRSHQMFAMLIVGDDNRVQVPETMTAPWRSFGQVGKFCTGTVVGPRHILTAAHCVYDINNKALFHDLNFFPARNGYEIPYGEYPWEFAFFPDEFKQGDMENFRQYDYAIIILKDYLDTQIEPIPYSRKCSNQVETLSLNIAGYPSDKQFGTMYTTGCMNVRLNCGWGVFEHFCDTFGGMSGSSMFIAFRQGTGFGFEIKAIHTSGNFINGGVVNAGVIINEDVAQQITTWIEQYP